MSKVLAIKKTSCVFMLFFNIIFVENILYSQNKSELYQDGVSLKLAEHRRNNISNIEYKLFFSIPRESNHKIDANLTLSFTLKNKKSNLILDFKENQDKILQIITNNKKTKYIFKNEHIIIAPEYLKAGKNSLSIKFIAGEQSLNRNKDYLYTLLVPDRARTLFPCFDQPNLKAKFSLTLDIPKEWTAVSNSFALENSPNNGEYKTVSFHKTEALSTYLFSFVVGSFKESVHGYMAGEKNKIVKIYHRETDSLKIAQLEDIASQVFTSLEWMEKYTETPYPFSKYDLIILPGFQYGGMEHTGATLYSSEKMFLPSNPTIQQKLSRGQLIAHETAHMWFGDYVTMNWFSDVWIKEVFANFFAAKIMRPLFPDINHALSDMDFYKSAYLEDRTLGSNAIAQDLPNLKYAGLIYGNIIYQKSPIVMNMLYEKMGEKNFRKGIVEYVKKYAYSNAGWNELISIFSKYYKPISDNTINGTKKLHSLAKWSYNWINQKGMPCAEFSKGTLKYIDTYNRGIVWDQELKIDTISTPNGNMYIPNTDGKYYGYIQMDSVYTDYIIDNFNIYGTNPVKRLSLLITLNENYLNNNLDTKKYLDFLLSQLDKEKDIQIFPSIIQYISKIVNRSFTSSASYPSEISLYVESKLLDFIQSTDNKNFATQTFRVLSDFVTSPSLLNEIRNMWEKENNTLVCPKTEVKLLLNANDYISLAYNLAIKQSDYKYIIDKQHSRISNLDKLNEFDFISRACTHNEMELDSLFNSLLKAENRTIEPWTQSVLKLLNHPSRQDHALKYIKPGLVAMEDVQKTGDIFFPKGWISSILSGHHSKESEKIVKDYLLSHPKMLPLLKNKILQCCD